MPGVLNAMGGNYCSVVTLNDLEASSFGGTVCPTRNAVGLHSIQSRGSLAAYSEAAFGIAPRACHPASNNSTRFSAVTPQENSSSTV